MTRRRLLPAVALAATVMIAGCNSGSTVSHRSSSAPSATSGTASKSASPSPSTSSSTSTAQSPSGDSSWKAGAPETPALGAGINSPVSDPTYSDYGHPETDVRTSNLDIRWDGKTLTGKATIQLAATRDTPEVGLDLSDKLKVSSVTVDGKPATHTQSGHVLKLSGPFTKGKVRKVVIDYAGAPASVSAPSTRGDQTEGLGWVVADDKSISTYAEPYGALTWAPVNETPSDKTIYQATLRAKVPQTGVFNGERTSQKVVDGFDTTTWKTSEPMSAYLLTLNFGQFKAHPVTLGDGKVATVYLRPSDDSLLPEITKDLPWAYKQLTSKLGEYPFSSLGMVVTDGESAMETQTMPSFGAPTIQQTGRDVILHELAHQWFGDAVTTRVWKDLWLNEGFAMFMEMQDSSSPDEEKMAEIAPRMCALTATEDGPAGNVKRGHFAGSGPYMCGAVALAELRDQAGSEKFWSAMKGWPKARRFDTATRQDFITYWKQATGKDPSAILAKWLDTASESTTTTSKIAGG